MRVCVCVCARVQIREHLACVQGCMCAYMSILCVCVRVCMYVYGCAMKSNQMTDCAEEYFFPFCDIDEEEFVDTDVGGAGGS